MEDGDDIAGFVGDAHGDRAQLVAACLLARFGRQQAISGGQFAHPKGVFYGGAGPTWSRRTQTAIFAHYLTKAAKVAFIDYHTGLGPWGYGEQILTDRKGSAAFAKAKSL